ncbi:hypothetical protein SBRY_60541 [Actinacidiphila bryophytorum]|uniref:Uncharacterized protein n=1 Tax=Actinacidiphila bryophytorum TaxID=1436133 RepID=A0A9W4H6R7_9ACTN|nr:hypothetical protein SBRY_60541 [Actinacidiphila bryophytorum]
MAGVPQGGGGPAAACRGGQALGALGCAPGGAEPRLALPGGRLPPLRCDRQARHRPAAAPQGPGAVPHARCAADRRRAAAPACAGQGGHGRDGAGPLHGHRGRPGGCGPRPGGRRGGARRLDRGQRGGVGEQNPRGAQLRGRRPQRAGRAQRERHLGAAAAAGRRLDGPAGARRHPQAAQGRVGGAARPAGTAAERAAVRLRGRPGGRYGHSAGQQRGSGTHDDAAAVARHGLNGGRSGGGDRCRYGPERSLPAGAAARRRRVRAGLRGPRPGSGPTGRGEGADAARRVGRRRTQRAPGALPPRGDRGRRAEPPERGDDP